MTYHMLPARPLGIYTGFDKLDDPLTKEIIKRQGDTSTESLKAYGKIAGSMAASGACAATGAGAGFVAICGFIGGYIGALLGAAVPVAKGYSTEDLANDIWGDTVPLIGRAQKGILAVHAYLTMRDAAISDIVMGFPNWTGAQDWADAWLSQHGLPSAPVDPRWAPIQERTTRHQLLLASPMFPDGTWGYAKSAGYASSQLEWELLVNGPGKYGPVAKLGDPIDWGLVGFDENAAHWKDFADAKKSCTYYATPVSCADMASGKYTLQANDHWPNYNAPCAGLGALSVRTTNPFVVVSPFVFDCSSGDPNTYLVRAAPSSAPSVRAASLIASLRAQVGDMQSAAEKASLQQFVNAAVKVIKAENAAAASGALTKAAVGAGIIAALWWLFL